jgi:hypothetical protein
MDFEQVKQLEAANDGRTIYLFFDETVGVYLAFGLSAYYSSMIVTPYVSYSEAVEMPVALLRKGHVNSLRQSMKIVEHTPHSFYRLSMREPVGIAGYEKWTTNELKKTKL